MFALKKLISAFLMPLPLGLLFIFIGLVFLYKSSYFKSKIFIAFGIVWLLLLSYEPVVNSLLIPLEYKYKALTNDIPKVKYIMVLGNGHYSNEKLPITSKLSITSVNRLSEAIRIYKKIPNAKIIVSGYKGADIKNSNALMQKKFLESMGILSKNIIALSKPKDTYEEALEAKKIVKEEKFILVTTASHMTRAMMLFKKQKLKVIAAPTNHYAKNSGKYYSRISSYNLYKAKLAFHEYIGILWGKLRGYL